MDPCPHTIELKVAILLTMATVFSGAFLSDLKIAYLSDTPTGYRQTIVIAVEAGMVLLTFLTTIAISHRCFSGREIHDAVSRRFALGAITFVPAISIAFILDDVSRIYADEARYSTRDIILVSTEAFFACFGFAVLWFYIRYRMRRIFHSPIVLSPGYGIDG